MDSLDSFMEFITWKTSLSMGMNGDGAFEYPLIWTRSLLKLVNDNNIQVNNQFFVVFMQTNNHFAKNHKYLSSQSPILYCYIFLFS